MMTLIFGVLSKIQHCAQTASVYVRPSEIKVKTKHAQTLAELRYLIYGQPLHLKVSAGATISTSFLGSFVQHSMWLRIVWNNLFHTHSIIIIYATYLGCSNLNSPSTVHVIFILALADAKWTRWSLQSRRLASTSWISNSLMARIRKRAQEVTNLTLHQSEITQIWNTLSLWSFERSSYSLFYNGFPFSVCFVYMYHNSTCKKMHILQVLSMFCFS